MNYKAAWELKNNVIAGKYLAGRGYLANSHESWILALVGALEAMPAQVLPAGGGFEINFAAMSSPRQEPLRLIASEVLKRFDGLSRDNAKFLRVG